MLNGYHWLGCLFCWRWDQTNYYACFILPQNSKSITHLCFLLLLSPLIWAFYTFRNKRIALIFFFVLFYFFGMRGLMGKDFYQQDLAVLLRPEPEGVALFIFLFFKKVALKHFNPDKMWSLLAHFEADNMPHCLSPPRVLISHKFLISFSFFSFLTTPKKKKKSKEDFHFVLNMYVGRGILIEHQIYYA